jgi:hypothetical protein
VAAEISSMKAHLSAFPDVFDLLWILLSAQKKGGEISN